MKKYLVILPFLLFFVNCQDSLLNSNTSQNIENNVCVFTSPMPVNINSSTDDRKDLQSKNVAKNENIFWEGKSGNYYMVWSNRDLYLSNDKNSRQKSFWKSIVLEDFDKLSETSKGLKCGYVRNFELLSVVGNFITFYDTEIIICGIPSTFPNIITLDVSKTQQLPKLNTTTDDIDVIKLTDIFSNEEIFHAVSNNKKIKAFLKKLSKYPETLDDLLKLIDTEYNLHEAGDYYLSNLLDNFAFNYIKDDKVSIRLFLMPTSGYNQSTTQKIDLLLPIPDKMKSEIYNASELKEGFLMKDMPKLTKGEKTVFENSFSN